ncbi:MAG: alpha/beta hydrolase [Leptolyngbyaceae bacterium]|nr:alpha/beta hydrolase [Leptolyngbyaceae bacterium]
MNCTVSARPPATLLKLAGLALSLAGSIVLLGQTVLARSRDRVLLQYHQTTIEVPLSDLQTLAATGATSPALAEYFQSIDLTPEETQRILSQVVFDEGIPISSNSVEFLTIQTSRSIGDVLRRERREDMLTALRESFADDRQISIIEIIENYPDSITRVNLGRLDRLQSDLELFVERIEPILSVVELLLPELVCDCLLEEDTLPEASYSDDVQRVGIAPPLYPEPKAAPNQQLTNNAEKTCNGTTLAEKRAIYEGAIAQLTTIMNEGSRTSSPMAQTISFLTEDDSLSPDAVAQMAPAPLIPLSLEGRSRIPDPVIEDVTIAFGPFRPSFSVAALEEFIETGNLPNGWRFYLSVAGLSSEEFRTALTEEVDVDFAFMDGLLNNILGEYVLYQVGTVIHTPSGDANIQALRSALILASIDDGKVSLFEFIQRYPASQIIVEGLNLARLGNNLRRRGVVRTTTARLEDLLLELQAGVADSVCNCAQE